MEGKKDGGTGSRRAVGGKEGVGMKEGGTKVGNWKEGRRQGV